MQRAIQLHAQHGIISTSPGLARPALSPDSNGNGMSVGAMDSSKILRFAKSERTLHWAIAGPFLVSFATGVILATLYNPDPTRPYRSAVAILHRASGIALAILPMLALLSARRDVRIHLYNIRQAWTWIYDDFKWLALMGLAAIRSRFTLPEQGKFNAAEKLNFMVLMSTYPLYVVTGIFMWLIPLAVFSWIMHCLMAMMATPLVLGHLYMALINRDTRPGLEGMISGQVDRQWAKQHYRRWYRKYHETTEECLPEVPRILAAEGYSMIALPTNALILPTTGISPITLEPARFLHLCAELKRAEDSCSFLGGMNLAQEFDRMLKSQPEFVANRIVTVGVGVCVKSGTSHTFTSFPLVSGKLVNVWNVPDLGHQLRNWGLDGRERSKILFSLR